MNFNSRLFPKVTVFAAFSYLFVAGCESNDARLSVGYRTESFGIIVR